VADLVARFFAEDADEQTKRVLDDELRSRTSGSRYFTFNVFNVRLDFDEQVATIEDELDAQSAESLPLDDFRKAVESVVHSAARAFSNDARASSVNVDHQWQRERSEPGA
jgi:hypothetical protein